MKKLILIAALCFAILNGLNAQNIGETWLLSKVDIAETINGNTTHQEILATDTKALTYLMGPKEIVFLSDSKLSYKRMDSDNFEAFLYARNGETLKIELSECLLQLNIKVKESEMLLSENKNIDENHSVIITYSYTK